MKKKKGKTPIAPLIPYGIALVAALYAAACGQWLLALLVIALCVFAYAVISSLAAGPRLAEEQRGDNKAQMFAIRHKCLFW